MAGLATIVALSMAGVLLWAGLEKARSPAAAVSTLQSLGVAERSARPWVRLLAAVEVALALGLVFRPHAPWTTSGVAVLAALFAAAGVAALRRDGPIPCNCFGPLGRGRLGWDQVLALPCWLAGCAVVALGVDGAPAVHEATRALAAVALVLAGLRTIALARSWREARADRRSAEEMLTWLPR